MGFLARLKKRVDLDKMEMDQKVLVYCNLICRHLRTVQFNSQMLERDPCPLHIKLYQPKSSHG